MYVNFLNYLLMYNISYFDFTRLLFMMFFHVYCVIEPNVWCRFLCFMVVDFKWVFKKIFYHHDMSIINLYNIYKHSPLNMFNICVNLKDEPWCCQCQSMNAPSSYPLKKMNLEVYCNNHVCLFANLSFPRAHVKTYAGAFKSTKSLKKKLSLPVYVMSWASTYEKLQLL